MKYTILRLGQGNLHAFTVLTSNNYEQTEQSVSGGFTLPQPRWKLFTVADRGGACLTAGAVAAAADIGVAAPPGTGTTAANLGEGGTSGPDTATDTTVSSWDRQPTGDARAITALPRGAGKSHHDEPAIAGVGITDSGTVQSITPSVTGIRVTPGSNPGEVVVSWDTVLAATHYRIGYVNVDAELPRARARGGKWTDAFVYVDITEGNLPKSGGRVKYTILRLGQGNLHAFTVLTSNNYEQTEQSVSGGFRTPNKMAC